MMSCSHKPFDPTSHRDNDARCKLAVIEALQARFPMWKAVPHQDKIGSGEYADILILDPLTNDTVHRVEVEVKGEWKDGTQPFSFQSFHIPERKLKQEYDGITLHAIVSADENGIFFVDRSIVERAQTVYKKCANHGTTEAFQSIIKYSTMPGRFYMKRKRRDADWQNWDGN